MKYSTTSELNSHFNRKQKKKGICLGFMQYLLQFIKSDFRGEVFYKMQPEEARLLEGAYRNKEIFIN